MRHCVIVGLFAAAASPIFAQPAPAPAPMGMAMAKAVTRAELTAIVHAHFAKRDLDRDGVLTADELAPRGGQVVKLRRGGGMAGDSHAGGEHAMPDPEAAFDRIDTNRDGSISRDEFAGARQLRIERRVILDKDGKAGATMDHGRMGGMAGGALLKLADANGDGRVTLAEATTAALRHFDMMDGNRDGVLSPEERAAGRVHIRQMRRPG